MIAVSAPAIAFTKPKATRRRWPWIIAGLLIAHTTVMLVMVSIATRDASFSVDPDYYGKAVRWDQDQARLRASEQLGWRLQILPANSVDSAGVREVIFELTDAAGAAIPDAVVEATYFHHARGRDIRTATLSRVVNDPKRFSSLLIMPHAGTWQFQITARAGTHEYIKTETVEVR